MSEVLGYSDEDFVDVREMSAIEKVLFDFGNEMQKGMQVELSKKRKYGHNQIGSGDLYQSINFKTKIFGGVYEFRLSLADYYDYVNKGVKGFDSSKNINHNSNYRFKTVAIKNTNKLKLWARKRNLNPFAIARSVASKGTEGSHFYDKVVTKQRLDKLSKDLTKASGEDVMILLSNTFNKIAKKNKK